jgi:hypothetical protein
VVDRFPILRGCQFLELITSGTVPPTRTTGVRTRGSLPASARRCAARTVINVGAGTGSYEPPDRWVLAVEPSAAMRAGRPPGAAPVITARAEALAKARVKENH